MDAKWTFTDLYKGSDFELFEIYSPYTGEVYEPDPTLTSLPLREYPILLTERDCFEIIPNT